MTNAKQLINQTTRSDNSKLVILACALGFIILAVLYAKIIGF
jgi:hypothetical protein